MNLFDLDAKGVHLPAEPVDLLLVETRHVVGCVLRAAAAQFKKLSTYLTANAVWLWLFDGYVYAGVTSNVHGFSLPPTRELTSIAKATVS